MCHTILLLFTELECNILFNSKMILQLSLSFFMDSENAQYPIISSSSCLHVILKGSKCVTFFLWQM